VKAFEGEDDHDAANTGARAVTPRERQLRQAFTTHRSIGRSLGVVHLSRERETASAPMAPLLKDGRVNWRKAILAANLGP
jgi:hypothetical protein